MNKDSSQQNNPENLLDLNIKNEDKNIQEKNNNVKETREDDEYTVETFK